MPYKPTPSLRSLVTVATADDDLFPDFNRCRKQQQQPPPIPARRQLFNRVAQRASASSGSSSTSSGSSIAIADFRHPDSPFVTFGRAKMRHPRNGCVYVNVPKESGATNGTSDGQGAGCGSNPFEDDDGDDGSDDVDNVDRRPAFQAFTRNDAQFARLRQRVNRIQHRLTHAQSLANLPTNTATSTEAIIHPDNRITIHVRYGAEETVSGAASRQSRLRPLSPAYSAQSSRRTSSVSSSASSSAAAVRRPDPVASRDDGIGQVFAERAIDVPPDFERNAYAKEQSQPDRELSPSPGRKLIRAGRQLSPSLQDFLQNDWVYVNDANEVDTQSSSPFWPSWQEFMQDGWVYVDEVIHVVDTGDVDFLDRSDEDWIDLDEQFEDEHIHHHPVHPITGRRTSIRMQSGHADSAIMKSVKNQLRKQAQRFKLSRLRKNMSTSTPTLREDATPDIIQVRPARNSTNPFEDCDEEEDEAAHSAEVATVRYQQLEQLLQRLAPYCYSEDPLAAHRFQRPIFTGHRSTSILTRSLEVNNAEKCDIVAEYLRSELQPRALLTRRYWSQGDVQDGQHRHRRHPAGTHRLSLGVSSLAAKSRQMCNSLQNALARSNRSLSETNLSTGHGQAWGDRVSGDYCPGGVYQSRRRAVGRKGQQQPTAPHSQTLRGRWKLWTTQLRRNRNRVGDAGGHGDT